MQLGAMTPEEVVAGVLRECQGPLSGKLGRAVLYVTEDGEERRIACVSLPTSLRLERPAGGTWIANGDQVWECRAGETATELQGDRRRELLALREMLDAATLGPLVRAAAVEREAPNRIALREESGAEWSLTLREDTLLPESLRGPMGTTRFVDWLRTSVTWMPKRVRHDVAGARTLRFEQHDVRWDELFFLDPESRPQAATGPEPTSRMVVGRERRPSTPEPSENRAMFWLLLDDPGDWPARMAAYRRHWSELARQGQKLAGFPAFCDEGERRRMIIPFRPAEEGRPFVRPEGWEVLRKPREEVLVVYPRQGDLDHRIADGARQLAEAARARGLAAVGPVCAQPYLDWDADLPEPAELADAVVRVSLAVR